MEKKDLRIVYMGTPDFAVESLKRLVEGGYNVVGVDNYDPTNRWVRHGSVLQPSPVERICCFSRSEGTSAGEIEG